MPVSNIELIYNPNSKTDFVWSWTMSLLRFGVDLKLSEDDTKRTDKVTTLGFNAWVLVNDYFSWEKELSIYESRLSKGEIANAVFLLAKWNSSSWVEAKALVREEIIAREKLFSREKEALLAEGGLTAEAEQWLDTLDDVTAGNFAWSMTTPRYDHQQPNAYPSLRASLSVMENTESPSDLSKPICSAQGVLIRKLKSDCPLTVDTLDSDHTNEKEDSAIELENSITVLSLDSFEEVSQSFCFEGIKTNLIQAVLGARLLHRVAALKGSQGIRNRWPRSLVPSS
jgi:hypothetical protein